MGSDSMQEPKPRRIAGRGRRVVPLVAAAMGVLAAVSRGWAPSAEAQCARPFQRGDSNTDGKMDISDAIATLGFLFLGSGAPSCVDAADTDDSGVVDLSDAVYTVSYLFLGGEAVPPPLIGACGEDPTEDALGCAAYGLCLEPAALPCDSNDCCSEDSYCEKDVDDCDGVGVCVVRPVICPRFFDPWCGCDGVTYGNRCEASAAGVNVVHRGECLEPGECLTSDDCAPEDYCRKEVGLCDEPGTCTRDPQLCAQIFDPVCGCDGVTYANSCIAAQSGVSVERAGPCEAEGDCSTSDDCALGSFCSKVEGFCEEPGFCRELPDPAACDGLPIEPVCGCDGVTYDTPCAAALAGANVLRHGPCEEGVPCSSSEDCDEDFYCYRKDGQCGEEGLCLERPAPERCAELGDDPVCGCDEATYRNECEAHIAGVSVAYRGACDGIPRCSSNKDCDEASYCATPEGQCGGVALCAERPVECPEDLRDPVCGCDGLTYTNECLAAQAGVAIQFRGTCDGGSLDCQTSATCSQGSFCAKPAGECDGDGQCEIRPTDCPKILDPVCGCDGITYDNECLAHAAGVNVLSSGPCE